jgi:acetyl-CoA synthetase
MIHSPLLKTQIRSWEDYLEVYRNSLLQNDLSWESVALSKIKWRKLWRRVSDCDYANGKVNWYSGAELNVAENCLDRHIENGLGEKKALVWVGNHPGEEKAYTFRELHREVCQVANAFESYGIKKGDRVVLYLPNIPELAISMLACARIGAIHSVIFGGFSAHSIQSRVNDCGASLIVTADGTFRGKKWIDLKDNVDEAMRMGCPSVKHVVVCRRNHSEVCQKKIYDIDWKEFVHENLPSYHSAPSLSAQDPLFILYTSGSTGQPKGVLHAMGGYLTYASYTYEIVFQPKNGDIHWCTADLGWITAHSYLIYGPLSNGVTTLMFEGVPTYPDPGRFWEIIDLHQVSIFYTAPTAIRLLAGLGDSFVKKYSRKSLRILGSVGEPISPEAWKWYFDSVGNQRCPIVDTWWQTETGGILISPLAGISPTEPGSASFPLPGIEPKILNDQGEELKGVALGNLVLARSWPGQMVGVYGDPQRFYKTYFTRFEEAYFTGDGAHRNENGLYWITGRTDDVIKISGHRLGTAEIEAACLTHPGVIESAAVGMPDALTGEALCLFVVLKDKKISLNLLKEELTATVRKEVGVVATPQKIYEVPGLPKTRSGKIMRRILKKIALGQEKEWGDISTLTDPGIIEKIVSCIGSE